MRQAVIIPVYNEAKTLACVLDAVRASFAGHIVVVNDGSTDATPDVLAKERGVDVITHETNIGYGQSLIDGFARAAEARFDQIVTMDCDGQHEPACIVPFFDTLATSGADIVSGSRYLPESRVVGAAPHTRREVNQRITALVNARTGWRLSDAFCGFKAYAVPALARLGLREAGYALPMELWAKAHRAGFRVVERPVPRIYFDNDRSFGADLDDPERRYAYYVRVWDAALRNGGPAR